MIMLSMSLQVVHLHTTMFEEEVRDQNYPLEIHSARTKDDYILTIFRIQARGSGIRNGLQPLILSHGLDEISHAWIMSGQTHSLGFVLADRGFDVWIMNNRGSAYSRSNMNYHVHDGEMWDFSFQEMALYDVPAILELVSNKTGGKKSIIIGHSQGATQFIAAMSDSGTSESVQRHILGFIGISPVTHVSDVVDKMRLIYDVIEKYVGVHGLFGINYPYLSSTTRTLYKRTMQFVCDTIPMICEGIMSVPGLSIEHNRRELIPKFFQILPGGASFRCYLHFKQLSHIESDIPILRKYDFGEDMNMKRYGSVQPPNYDFSLIDRPVKIHTGNNDVLVSSTSIQRFTEYYKSIGKDIQTVYYDSWDHFSVYLSKDPTIFFDNVISDIYSMI